MSGIDPSVVARVTGIDLDFVDLRGGSPTRLPQQVFVLAQVQTGKTLPVEKVDVTSLAKIGASTGYRCPAYLGLRELLPPDGRDGVGSIPIHLYPLQDAAGAVAAAGGIAVSGTGTKQVTKKLRIGGIETGEWVVPAGAVDATTQYRKMHEAITAILHIPVLPTYTYGTVTATADAGNAGDGTVTALSVDGTPVAGDHELELVTAVADGGVWKLTDPNGKVIATDITMTPGAGGTTVINEGDLQFTITDGSADFEVGDKFTIAVPATALVLTAGWKGATGNDIVVEVLGDDNGVTFGVTAMANGAVNPDVTPLLALMGDVWETMGLNGNGAADATTLNALKTFGEGRWDTIVGKPFVIFHGNSESDVDLYKAVTEGRTDDRVTSQLAAPGSPTLPIVIAARQLMRVVKQANAHPPSDYGRKRADGVVPGPDNVQWNHTQRDLIVKAGSSTAEIRGGVVSLSDIVTPWNPEGEVPPAYRAVVDIVRCQNVLYSVRLEFDTEEWDEAVIVDDDQVTDEPNVRRLKDVIGRMDVITDRLGRAAIITSPGFTKSTTYAKINPSNPKGIIVGAKYKFSNNPNVRAFALEWGFNFGG